MSSLKQVETFWGKVCFDPNYQPQGRFQTYRELVFDGMLDVLDNLCPVAREILVDEEWQKIFWNFLRKAPPQSTILRKLPFEVSQYLKSLKNNPFKEKYPYLGELMEYEYLEIQVLYAPEDQESAPPGQVRLNPAHALAHYHWPVHFIDKEHADPKKLPQGDYYLFLWREPQTLEVKFMEVNPITAALLEQLRDGVMKPDALLRGTAEKMEIDFNEEYQQEGQGLLKQLQDKGVLV